MDNDRIIIEIESLHFSYPGRGAVLDGVDFVLERGRKIGLVGPNGSGKTTLLHLIMGLMKPDSGTIKAFGKPVRSEKDFREVRRRIGLLFQNADDQLFSPTVLEDVAFGPLNHGKSAAEAHRMAMETLEALNLKGFEDRLTHKLSGGEKKLVSLATVLVTKPDLLLLDEPTTGLDRETVERIIGIFNDLDLGYVIVSHESAFLDRTTSEVIHMKNGRLDSPSC